MAKHIEFKKNPTATFGARFSLLVMLGSILSSCSPVLQTSLPSQPEEVSPLYEQVPSTQVFPLVSTAEMATEVRPTITQNSDLTGVFTELQNINPLLESIEDVDNIILASEQVFSDFFNRVIPTNVDLRINEKNEHAEIGQSENFTIPDRGTFAYVQVVLMGGFRNADGAYLLLGTEDQSTRERLVLPIQVTFGYGEVYSTVQVQIDGGLVKQLSPEFKNSNPLDADGLLDIAKEYLGKVIVIQTVVDYKYEIITDGDRKSSIEKYDFVERQKSNNALINNPSTLERFDLKLSPISQRIVF